MRRPNRIPLPGAIIRVNPSTDGISYPHQPRLVGRDDDRDPVELEQGTWLFLAGVMGPPQDVTLIVLYDSEIWMTWHSYDDETFHQTFEVLIDRDGDDG